MDQTQADAVAAALLALPDKPTQRDMIAFANKLWRDGFRCGVMAQSRANEITMEAIHRVLEPGRA